MAMSFVMVASPRRQHRRDPVTRQRARRARALVRPGSARAMTGLQIALAWSAPLSARRLLRCWPGGAVTVIDVELLA